MWSGDSRELFFTTPDHRIMMSEVMAGGTSFGHKNAVLWSSVEIRQPGGSTYLVLHPDGRRFAVFPVPETSGQKEASVHLIFLLNFFDELRRRVPLK
jgi:hypothetical protein